LKALSAAQFRLECFSIKDLERVREEARTTPKLLFAPCWCDLKDYEVAYAAGAEVVVNNVSVFEQDETGLFKGKSVTIQVDPAGAGNIVSTVKRVNRLGHPVEDLVGIVAAAERAGATVQGLQVRCGMGPMARDTWLWWREALTEVVEQSSTRFEFIDIEVDVVEASATGGLDRLQAELASFCEWAQSSGDVKVRVQQGHYVLSPAGVLLSRVSQVRVAGGVRYICVATRPSAIMRDLEQEATPESSGRKTHNPPAVNLTHEERSSNGETSGIATYGHLVGPASVGAMDCIGRDQRLPLTQRGDVILVPNTWASRHASRHGIPEKVIPAVGCVMPLGI